MHVGVRIYSNTGSALSVAEMIAKSHTISEAFIDSTFITNQKKLELFAVILSVMGKGFPFAYPLFEMCNTLESPIDEQQIHRFWTTGKQTTLLFHTHFSFQARTAGS